ncbi:MAG: hypothetical protein JWN64_221 [Parcubacteria group bacterium]|nr:hypothetical protein [Parcubacteria group bacterium]
MDAVEKKIDDLAGMFARGFSELREDFNTFREEIHEDMDTLKEEMHGDMDTLREEMHGDMRILKEDVKIILDKHTHAVHKDYDGLATRVKDLEVYTGIYK